MSAVNNAIAVIDNNNAVVAVRTGTDGNNAVATFRVNMNPSTEQLKQITTHAFTSAGTCFTVGKIAAFCGWSKLGTIANIVGGASVLATLVAGVQTINKLQKDNQGLQAANRRLANQAETMATLLTERARPPIVEEPTSETDA